MNTAVHRASWASGTDNIYGNDPNQQNPSLIERQIVQKLHAMLQQSAESLKPETMQSAAGTLANYMSRSGVHKLDLNSLYTLAADTSDGTPSSVSKAASYMLQHPDAYRKIETYDVAASDGISGIDNFKRAAQSTLGSGSSAPTESSGAQSTGALNNPGGNSSAGFGNGSLGGANTVPDRIASPQAAAQMVDQVRQVGGGTLRIQMSHEEINNPDDMAKLRAMIQEGNKQGIKIQFTFRDNDNGGGGNVLSGRALQQACSDVSNVVSKLGNNQSFVLDTFNEGGNSATQGWADMQTALIQSARDAGYKGTIVVEDSNRGGGLAAGSASGLVKYASQLNAANGAGNPQLIGSIHEYASARDPSSALAQEIDAIEKAGYKPQIGEVGNANWNGHSFEARDDAVQAVKDNLGALKSAGATVLPWMDQFVNGSIQRTVGFSAKDQLL